jgi:intracellular septation protein
MGFFLFLAALNEVVWRNFSTDTWVVFKTFGVIPLTMVFTMAQITVIMEYQEEQPPANSPGAPPS